MVNKKGQFTKEVSETKKASFSEGVIAGFKEGFKRGISRINWYILILGLILGFFYGLSF